MIKSGMDYEAAALGLGRVQWIMGNYIERELENQMETWNMQLV